MSVREAAEVSVRPERSDDREAVHALNVAAFGQPAEADLVDALCDGGHAIVSLVAEVDGRVVGHILFSRVTIDGPSDPPVAASLAPMAVSPDCQRRGIGSRLVVEGLAACRGKGVGAVIVLGHPAFYPRFGFSADLAKSLGPYSGDAWMAAELEPDALAGVAGRVIYAPPFDALT